MSTEQIEIDEPQLDDYFIVSQKFNDGFCDDMQISFKNLCKAIAKQLVADGVIPSGDD